jgi:hypothetical protein
MKVSRLLLPVAIGLLAFVSACKLRMPHSTQEELGKSVFTALQKDDTLALQRVLASRADIEEAFGGDSIPAEHRAGLEQEIEGLLSDFRNMATISFLEIKRRSAEEGVDWKKAKFLKATTEDCHTSDTEICDIILHFSSAGKTWEIFIDNAGKAASGWILGFDTMTWMGEVL